MYLTFQALCKLLKNSISTLVDDCVAILPVILEIIPQLYEVSLNPSILDLVKQVSTVLNSDFVFFNALKIGSFYFSYLLEAALVIILYFVHCEYLY